MMSTDNEKPIKPSDSIIDYPDISKESVKAIQDQISLWVGGHDFYAVKWYLRYLEEEHSFYSDRRDYVMVHKIEIMISYIRNHYRDILA